MKNLVKPKNLKKEKDQWYTTTFSIPIWMADALKKEADENGYRGMNMVVVVACTNHLLSSEVRNKHNNKVNELFEEGKITNDDKKELWM